MKKLLIVLLALFAASVFAQDLRRPEVIQVYMPYDGKTGKTYPMGAALLIVYPERKCPFDDLPGSGNMVAATMNTSPLCAAAINGTVYIEGPHYGPKPFPNLLFAFAQANQNDTFTINQPGFDSEKMAAKMMQNRSDEMLRSRPGAALPPRGSSN